MTESLQPQWGSHSHTLRLSVLEKVAVEKDWQELVAFIERYGHDLFTQTFFGFGNLRAILHQGVDAWLDRLAADPESAEEICRWWPNSTGGCRAVRPASISRW